MQETIRKINKKIQMKKVENFYKNYLYQGRSYHSRFFNYFFTRFLIFIGAFLVFIYISEGERLYASLASGISVLIIYHLVTITLEGKRLENIKSEVNKRLAAEEFWKKIQALDKEGFILFIKEMLANLPGFYDVEVVNHLESEGINLICKYQGELVAVQCHLLDGENTVEPREARELSRAMSRRKYKKGIIISTTDFRDNTKAFCELIQEKRDIKLLGEHEFMQMAQEAGKFPIEDEVKNIILKKVEHKERIWLNAQKKIFARPRIMPYFIYGTIFLLLLFGFYLFFTV